jgi:hypothetical protein
MLGFFCNWSIRRSSFHKNWLTLKTFRITMCWLCLWWLRMQWRMVRRLLLLRRDRSNYNWRCLSLYCYIRFMLCSIHRTSQSTILPKCTQIFKRLVKSSNCLATSISNYWCFWIPIPALFLGCHYWPKLRCSSWSCSSCGWLWSWRWNWILSC